MGIRKPLVSEVAYGTYLINEFGMASCYLLLGESRGLLIDTGCGMYNIKAIADQFCELEYDVVLTHGHGDHLGSADLWKKVWLHPDDFTMAKDLGANREMMLRYPDMMRVHGSFEAYDITPEQLRLPEGSPEYLPLVDGQVFDLGSRLVEVLFTPGHTAGEIVLIDEKEKLLFSGDACNPNLGILSTSVNTALRGLLKIKGRQESFNRNMGGHAGYGGNTDNLSMPAACLDDCISIMRGVLDGTAEVIYEESPFQPGARVGRVRRGTAMVTFNPDRILDDGEEYV